MYWPPGNIDPRLPQWSGLLAKAVPSVGVVSNEKWSGYGLLSAMADETDRMSMVPL
jgi:hypothetical protein